MATLAGIGLERGGHPRLGGEHGGHQPARRQRLHEPGPLGDQPQAVFQGEHARHAGRGEFAHAVAQHRGRLDSPASPQRRPRQIPGRTSPAAYSRSDPAPRRLRAPAATTSGRSKCGRRSSAQRSSAAESRLRLVERAAHAGILGPLAGKEEGDPRRPVVLGQAAVDARRGRIVGEPRILSRNSPIDAAATAARCVKCVRPAFAVWAMSANDGPGWDLGESA